MLAASPSPLEQEPYGSIEGVEVIVPVLLKKTPQQVICGFPLVVPFSFEEGNPADYFSSWMALVKVFAELVEIPSCCLPSRAFWMITSMFFSSRNIMS